MFSSSFGTNDDEIIAYLKAGFEKGNDLEIYAHSRGAAAAVRIANKLGPMHPAPQRVLFKINYDLKSSANVSRLCGIFIYLFKF